MRIVVAVLLLLASPLCFEAYAQDDVISLQESLRAIREAVYGDAGLDYVGESDSRALVDFFRGLSIETRGLLPAEVEVVLHVVAVQSESGGFSLGIRDWFNFSTTGSPDWIQGSNAVTVKFRNAAFAKSDELIFQLVMREPGAASGDDEEQN